MPLALAHGHPAPAFNGLFYATVAAIIPVLFLAIAVQGPALRELLGASEKAAEQALDSRLAYVKGHLCKRHFAYRVIAGIAGIAGGIVPQLIVLGTFSYGVLEEIQVVSALSSQHPDHPGEAIFSVAFLAVVAAISPYIAACRSLLAVGKRLTTRVIAYHPPDGHPEVEIRGLFEPDGTEGLVRGDLSRIPES